MVSTPPRRETQGSFPRKVPPLLLIWWVLLTTVIKYLYTTALYVYMLILAEMIQVWEKEAKTTVCMIEGCTPISWDKMNVKQQP